MIVTIAEQFAGNPSDRKLSPTIIWKPESAIVAIVNDRQQSQ